MPNNCPPACHTCPINQPAPLGGKSVIYSLGLAACSLAASSANLANVTWMLGWVLFQSATDLSTPVTQAQKVNFTGPLEVPLVPELGAPPPPPQAARGAMINSRTLTIANSTTKRRVQRIEKRCCIV